MSIPVNHWLYSYIPHHRQELPAKPTWQRVTWALFGNDDDGIFGEGPHSGHRWIERWGGTVDQEAKVVKNLGEISFFRFIAWQLRNPLHNFCAYVIGFKGAESISIVQLALITTRQVSLYRKMKKINAFPMQGHSGIYLGLHNFRPFFSMRLLVINVWLESYAGWRPRGGFGLACRFKKALKEKASID